MQSAFAKIVTTQKPVKLEPLKASGSKQGISGALIATYRGGLRAVVKVSKSKLPNGNRNQRGLPVSTQPQREVAFYELAKLFGPDFEELVPETVLTTMVVPDAVASAQIFLPGTMHLHDINDQIKKTKGTKQWRHEIRKTALLVPKLYWRRLLALDITAGARDRHAHNVGLQLHLKDNRPKYRLKAWDNACTFGRAFTRYHNVFHKFLFRRHVNFDAIWPVWDNVSLDAMQDRLGKFLSPEEVADAYQRIQFFQEYPYRLPWKVCSDGHDSPREFPPYLAFFQPVIEQPGRLVALKAA